MKESATYQAILEEGEARGLARGLARGKAEGKAEEARRILLRLARKRLGEPSQGIVEAIEGISDAGRLEALAERVLDIGAWEDLLESPGPQ